MEIVECRVKDLQATACALRGPRLRDVVLEHCNLSGSRLDEVVGLSNLRDVIVDAQQALVIGRALLADHGIDIIDDRSSGSLSQ